MSLKILFRQPWKLLICALFLAATMLAGLVFAIQYRLDGVSMDYTAETYAAVGTIYPTDAEEPAAAQIDPELVELLAQSDAVQDIENRGVLSAKLPGYQTLHCFTITRTAQHLAFVKATLTSIDDFFPATPYESAFYVCRAVVDKVYAAHSRGIQEGQEMSFAISWDITEPNLEIGRQYFFAGITGASTSGMYDDGMLVWSDYDCDYWADHLSLLGHWSELATWWLEFFRLYQHGFIPVPDGMTDEEADAYILDLWEQQGLGPDMETVSQLNDVATVYVTGDMQMLIPVVNETMYFAAGRGIRPDDAGKKVCVISQQLASQLKLRVGDSIPIALGDGCYENLGILSGYPLGLPVETLSVTYGEPEEYEIIGTYAFPSYDPDAALLFGYNDIFIPPSEDTPDAAYITPRTLSFRVDPASYDEFLDTMVDKLADKGYALQLTASKWEEVEPIYNAMAGRRTLTLAGAVLALVLGSAVWLLLLRSLYRREFALRELFGTPFGHSSGAFFVPFAVSGVLAGILAIAAADAVYLFRLQPQADALAPGRMPANSEVLALLIALVLIQLAVCALALLFLAWRTRKTALVKLLK